jgi:hypothetical protein
MSFLNVFVNQERQGSRTSWIMNPVSSSTLRVHVSQTHSKKTKTKKVLKKFFSFVFLNVFVKQEPFRWVLRTSWGHDTVNKEAINYKSLYVKDL